MDECVELLHDYPVLFVHITCQKEEHLRRAKERGISPNTIEKQLQLLIPQDTYDLTIDTSNEKCVDKIIEMLNCREKFNTFKTILSRRTL